MQHGDAVLLRQLLDRAGHQLLPAAGWPVRLGIDRDNLIGAVEQGFEVFGGKLGGAREDDAHGVLA
ncbi:hypothetical protein D3C71_2028160 [compost metagenome]